MTFFGTSNTTTSANANSASMMTLDDFRRVAAQFEAIRQASLRRSAEMVERMTCEVCGRKPTVTHEWGETIIVCIHVWNALHRLPKAKPPINGLPTLGLSSPLDGIRIELFDDGPARW